MALTENIAGIQRTLTKRPNRNIRMRGLNIGQCQLLVPLFQIHLYRKQHLARNRFYTSMTQIHNAMEKGHLPNTCQYTARTDRGDYLIQVAWPLCWSEDRVAPEDDANRPVSSL